MAMDGLSEWYNKDTKWLWECGASVMLVKVKRSSFLNHVMQTEFSEMNEILFT